MRKWLPAGGYRLTAGLRPVFFELGRPKLYGVYFVSPSLDDPDQ
jgi:hypothetical protein